MTDAISLFKKYPKSSIINAYKQYLKDNNRFRKKNDGYGTDGGNGLERPLIGNIHNSWGDFGKLPKAAIIVHAFTEGCDTDYLVSLEKKGFFEPKEWDTNFRHVQIKGVWVLKPLDWLAKNERHSKMYLSKLEEE